MTIALVAAAPGGGDALAAACRAAGRLEVWSPLAAPVGLATRAVLRLWARGQTDRKYRAIFALRAAIDRWAAGEVHRRRPRVVIASSLAARHTFAAARAVGAATVLVLDVPLLRALHRDLDRAAARWPERAFLRRYRAPSAAIARQEAERVLADRIVVRGAYAHSLCLADGVPAEKLLRLPAAAAPPIAVSGTRTGRIRLAGLAAARHGVDTALAATRLLGATLVVRIGEGTEPADLARQPGVAVDAGPVDAIVCPAICETYAAELATAAVPVVASPMASFDGEGPDPYDAASVAEALAAALRRTDPGSGSGSGSGPGSGSGSGSGSVSGSVSGSSSGSESLARELAALWSR